MLQTGHTALQRAAAEGHTDVVQHLIERGAPVDHQDEVVRSIFNNFYRGFFTAGAKSNPTYFGPTYLGFPT